MAETNSTLHSVLRSYLEGMGRGSAQELCVNTELSAPELSNWLAGRRDLPAHKLVSAINWLVDNGKLNITIN